MNLHIALVLLFCILTRTCTVTGADSVKISSPPWPHSDAWLDILKQLYERTEATIGFCFGADPHKIINTISQSFPWPLPVQNSSNADICSNPVQIAAHLCGPHSLEIYYRFMLLTEDPEKVPATKTCPAGPNVPSDCSPGFFRVQKSGQKSEKAAAHACCPGYFCPRNLICMIPCPLGAYCPRATPAAPPAPLKSSKAMWCAPYAYRERPGSIGCGGADKWTIVPGNLMTPSSLLV